MLICIPNQMFRYVAHRLGLDTSPEENSSHSALGGMLVSSDSTSWTERHYHQNGTQDFGFGLDERLQRTKDNSGGEDLYEPTIHVNAMSQVLGEAVYPADTGVPPGGLHGALAVSDRAHALIESIDASEALAVPVGAWLLCGEGGRAKLSWCLVRFDAEGQRHRRSSH